MNKNLGAILILLISHTSLAIDWVELENSESPYFEIKGGSQGDFQLLNTHVDVHINGIIANVVVTQSYKHFGAEVLDAKYLFPASNRAAVYGMMLDINDRHIQAKIERKQTAREKYKKALSEGKTAALLEQTRPNLFSFSAGNILPGDDIKVELKYTEYLVGNKGQYDFYFPTVVGPRYGSLETDAVPTRSKNTDIEIEVESGGEIFEPITNWPSALESFGNRIHVTSTKTDKQKQEFKFSFRMADTDFNSSFITYNEDNENYFVAMVHPPRRYVKSEVIAQDFIFVMDVSGSMSGQPMALSKELMHSLLNEMRPIDRFNIVQFAGGSRSLFDENQPANHDGMNAAFKFIEEPQGGGGTEVLLALQRAFSLVHTDNRSYNVVLITDGLVTVEREVFDLVLKNRDKANVFAFGTGVYGDNKYLFDGIAHAAGTEAFVIMDKQVDKYIAAFSEYLSTPLLTNVSVDFNGLDVYDVYPEVAQDIFTQRPLVISGKYRGALPESIIFSGNESSGTWSKNLKVQSQNTSNYEQSNNEAVKYLWAREKIKLLDDYQKLYASDDTEEIITRLGLKYNLLTKYTSFIAVDDLQRAPGRVPDEESQFATDSLIASGAASDDLAIEPVRLTQPETSLKYWNASNKKWAATCDSNTRIAVSKDTLQWRFLSQKLPAEFSTDSVICLPTLAIEISKESNLVIEQRLWEIIKGFFFA